MVHNPPFTAKSQMGLFQKIKEGAVGPLSRDRKTGHRIYSVEIEEIVRYANTRARLMVGHVFVGILIRGPRRRISLGVTR
jgi:hypothetical protein